MPCRDVTAQKARVSSAGKSGEGMVSSYCRAFLSTVVRLNTQEFKLGTRDRVV